MAIMTAQSTPNDNWGCGDWIYWHTLLKEEYGNYEANNIWISHYANQSIVSTVRLTCANTNTAFIEYFKTNGIDLNQLVNLLSSVSDGTESAITGIKKLISIAPYLLIALLLFVIYLIYVLIVKHRAYEKII